LDGAAPLLSGQGLRNAAAYLGEKVWPGSRGEDDHSFFRWAAGARRFFCSRRIRR